MESSFDFEVAILVYTAISVRWIYVIHRYHQQVLQETTEYKFSTHPIFKSILFGRACVLGSIAPLFAFVKPSYFAQFFNGVETKSSIRKVANGFIGRRID